MALTVWKPELREWQREAYIEWEKSFDTNFLIVATPGGGKTVAMLRIGHELLFSKTVDRLVVVVPTTDLKQQWAKSAHRCGIQLDPQIENGAAAMEAGDMHGCILTYQQVAASPQLHRHHCQRKRTAVLFDEVHHLADENSWGASAMLAFSPAVRRISGSGTPWRDNGAIPFIKYSELNECVPNYTYSYYRSILDYVCRPIEFPNYTCQATWTYEGEEQTATFEDELPEDESARRLRTALNTGGEFLANLLRDANRRLGEIRVVDPSAGGLVVCMDQQHAVSVAGLMKKHLGVQPVIVISSDSEASRKINQFRTGKDEWLVSVKMVSEGVDIPRLRVGVYASNVLSELVFRQFIGRTLRVIDSLREKHIDQTAYCFLPADPILKRHALRVEEELRHAIKKRSKSEEEGGYVRAEGELPFSKTIPLSATNSQLVDVVASQSQLPPEEIEGGRDLIRQVNPSLIHHATHKDLVSLFRIVRERGGERSDGCNSPQPEYSEPSDSEKKDAINKRINALVAWMGKLLEVEVKQSACWLEGSYKLIGTYTKIKAGIPCGSKSKKDKEKLTMEQCKLREEEAIKLKQRLLQVSRMNQPFLPMIRQMVNEIRSAF